MYKGGRGAPAGLSDDQVPRIVKRRKAMAGLAGDWAAHSLRSGSLPKPGAKEGRSVR
ncbi:hypothetical protein D3C77_348230 [compost metagenome]